MHYKATIVLAAAGIATASRIHPAKRALPSGWAAAGCYTDDWNRTLPNQVTVSGQMTNDKCAAACNAAGYSFSGSEAGTECWCGNALGGTGTKANDGDCSTKCQGSNSQNCGGGWRLSVSKKSTTTGGGSTGGGSTGGGSTGGGSTSTFTPPTNWAYDGCYSDSFSRTLPNQVYPSGTFSMTGCINTCAASGYSYAGAENGNECWCGNSVSSSLKAADGDCTATCNNQPCGGGWRLSTFKKASTPYTPPTGWTAAGCYTDSSSRSLNAYSYTDPQMTMTKCINTCAGKSYKLAATEAGTECYCGNTIANNLKAADGDCATSCGGDGGQTCGGGWRLSVYQGPSSGGSNTTPTTTPTSTPTTSPTTTPTGSSDYPGKSDGWTNEGCYTDASTRTMSGSSFTDGGMTVEKCQATCYQQKFKYAGVEAGTECYCSDTIPSNKKANNGDCTTPCAGSGSEMCGGGWRLSVYSKPPATSGPSSFERVGCFVDSANARFLRDYVPNLGNNNTPQNCIAACSAKGYGYAGVEYGSECYCGDQLWNVQSLDDSKCNIMKCPGDQSQYCGNGNAIMLYQDTLGWCS